MSPYPGCHVIVIISCDIALHLLDKNSAFNVELEKYRLFVRRQDRKKSVPVITPQSSLCKTEILGTDF